MISSRCLSNRRLCSLSSQIIVRNLATIAKTAPDFVPMSSQNRGQRSSTVPSSNFSSINITDKAVVSSCAYDHIHPRNDAFVETGTLADLPQYLRRHYWGAYISPTMISILDRKWLVDIVLWGNFTMLRDVAVNELRNTLPQGTLGRNSNSNCEEKIQGKTLQVACVYADLTETIVKNLAHDATLDVIDVVPAQLRNLQLKLQRSNVLNNHEDTGKITLSCCDASSLHAKFPSNNTFDNVLIFFLLHETPDDVRQKVLAEAFRVLKDDGKLVIIDYHKPTSALWCYIMKFMYMVYEPFAIDLWNHPISHWIPSKMKEVMTEKYFGGLYQKVVLKSGSNLK